MHSLSVPEAWSGNDPLFRWGRSETMIGTVVTEDDGYEVLHDGPDLQFSRFTIHPNRGAGVIEYLWDESMRVLLMNGNFRDEMRNVVIDDGWVRLNFSLSITIEMEFTDRSAVQETDASWRFFRLPPGDRSLEVVPARTSVQWATICCSPERLARIAGLHLDDLPFRIAGTGGDEDSLIYRPYRFSRTLKAVTTELFERGPHGALRAAHIGAKACELVVHALDHLLYDQSAASLQLRMTERDKQALHAARAYLDQNLAGNPTISAISRQVGINRNKLFYGFKSQFGVSVSEYLAEIRIDESVRLLQETDASLAEIAAAVGFRHQCNFSTAFRRRHGVSPRLWRNLAGDAT